MTNTPIRVSVDHRQWARGYIQALPIVGSIPIIQKYMRIGQGPHEFMQRLISESIDGVRYWPWPLQGDVGLFVVSGPRKRHFGKARKSSMPIIVRLDGIGFDSAGLTAVERERQKLGMADTIHHADGIVFQSQFSKSAFEQVFGEMPCISEVIHNGFVWTAKVDESRRENRLVVGGRNAPRKRIQETIRRFIDSPFSQTYCLDVVGSIPQTDELRHSSVNFLGKVKPSILLRRLSTATGLLHLDWYDWCPNLVLDAISVGTPVLCGSVGGTPEIVGESGIIANLDEPMPNFQSSQQEVPFIKQEVFDANLNKLIQRSSKLFGQLRPDLEMRNVAFRYKEFICRVGSGSV